MTIHFVQLTVSESQVACAKFELPDVIEELVDTRVPTSNAWIIKRGWVENNMKPLGMYRTYRVEWSDSQDEAKAARERLGLDEKPSP